jgi:hypothetical protein
MRNFRQNKKTSKFESFLIWNNTLAGCESDAGNPSVRDFVLLGQKLAQLGFMYQRKEVFVVESMGRIN